MIRIQMLAVVLLATAGVGCTSSHGRTYKAEGWRDGQPLGRVLVIVPRYATDPAADRPEKDRQIRAAVRDALAQIPGTQVIEEQPAQREPSSPVSESDALRAGREAGADTVCVATVGQFGGRYLLTLLPPGWDSRTSVQYSLRLLDVRSGQLLIDSIRERSAGGYLAVMTATYPDDLKADVASILSPRE